MAAAGPALAEPAQAEDNRIGQMTSMQARQFALQQIRALAAVANAGRNNADPQCRALAERAGDLGAAAVDAVVHVDKSRELHAVGTPAADEPAIRDEYLRVATTVTEARAAVALRAANCPDLLTVNR